MLRKCAHVTEYAILALLLYRAIGRELPAFLIGFAYAVTDEVHQAFVRGRHASPSTSRSTRPASRSASCCCTRPG